jgi:uncharacterized membrane protein YphA (DoxX/SURF4 family)
MIKNIITLVLLITSVFLSFKHGWDTFNYKNNEQSVKMMNELGIPEPVIPFVGLLTILIGVLLLLPKTFFLGNTLNAVSIVVIMALALRAGQYKMALIEIPFLALPLIMIFLKYPFRN